MNLFLLHLITIYSYRVLKLKLKENENLFVTNSNGKLKLKPPSKRNIVNQTVLVHDRRLLFIKDSQLYKMYLNPGSLDIKLKKDFKPKKPVGFLRSGMGRKRRVDPFGFAAKRGMKDDGGGLKSDKRETKKEERSSEEHPVEKKKEKMSFFKKSVSFSPPKETNKQIRVPEENENKQLEILKSLLASLEKGGEPIEEPPPSVNKGQEDPYFIESDSKIDEDTVKYQDIDVFISSLTKKYFKLKTNGNNCVTFMHNIFIFSPCINIDNQLFTLVEEEKLKEKTKRKHRKYEESETESEEELKSLSTFEDSEVEEDSSIEQPKKSRTKKIRFKEIKPKEEKEMGLLSYNNQIKETINENQCPTRSSPEYQSVCMGPSYNKEKCEIIKKKVEDCERKHKNNLRFFNPPTNPPQPIRTLGFNPPQKPSIPPMNPPLVVPERTFNRPQQIKKDFNPDDLINKLKESIKSNDYGDII